jgi:hypothetical protein
VSPAPRLSGALLVAGYLRIRQPILTSGATPAEAAGPLPGDELLTAADGVSTRATSTPRQRTFARGSLASISGRHGLDLEARVLEAWLARH